MSHPHIQPPGSQGFALGMTGIPIGLLTLPVTKIALSTGCSSPSPTGGMCGIWRGSGADSVLQHIVVGLPVSWLWWMFMSVPEHFCQ